MDITFKGKEAVVRKENFYCKAGAYDHKWRIGWVVAIGSEIVRGAKFQSNGHGAERYEYPEYKTRKSLLEDVQYFNDLHEKRQSI